MGGCGGLELRRELAGSSCVFSSELVMLELRARDVRALRLPRQSLHIGKARLQFLRPEY
jgi:hypothetical protein